MAVPTSLASLSTTPGSNPPGGAENPFPELDDHLRQMYAFSAQLRDQKAPLNNPTFTGIATAPRFSIDSFSMYVSGGAAIINFDPNDYIQFIRSTNVVDVVVGGSSRLTVGSSGPERPDDATTANGLVRKSQLDSATAAATTTARGTVELADATEARALTNAANALTPATLAAALTGANQSLSASGYQRLPGGLILQWGEVTTSASGDVSVTFPLAFPTACASVIGTGTQPINASVFVAASQTTTGFAATCWYTSSSSGTLRGSGVYRWIALGY